MSYYNLETTHPQDVIVSYVLELSRQGCFLPYGDYEIVGKWLKRVEGDVDELLLVLSEVLPDYYSSKSSSGNRRRRNLSGAYKLVMNLLDGRAMRKESP